MIEILEAVRCHLGESSSDDAVCQSVRHDGFGLLLRKLEEEEW